MLTSQKLSESVKLDVALAPVSLASAASTGAYHPVAGLKRMVFYFVAAVMAKTKTVVAQVMEAKTAAAGSAQALTSATATITANIKASIALITANTVADGTSTVIVTVTKKDGTTTATTYLCEDTTPDQDAGEWASGANDEAGMVNLAAAINHLQGDYLLATASAGPDVCTLTARKPGEVVITLSGEDSTMIASTLQAAGFVEVDAAQLTALYTHLALKLTTDATIVVGGSLIREGGTAGNANQGHAVAASAVL